MNRQRNDSLRTKIARAILLAHRAGEISHACAYRMADAALREKASR